MCCPVRNTLSGMPGTEGTAFGTGRHRRAIVAAGFGLFIGACSSPQATSVPTYTPTAVVRSALSDGPFSVGHAASGTGAGLGRGDGTPAVGTAAIDTVGGLLADGARISPFD